MEESERLRILRLIAEGKISPEEGEALLQALSAAPTGEAGQESGALKGRWLRVKVWENGQSRVNIRLPLRLVEVGLKIARRFAPEEDFDEMAIALNEAIQEGVVGGKIVEVEDTEDNQRVEIWIE